MLQPVPSTILGPVVHTRCAAAASAIQASPLAVEPAGRAVAARARPSGHPRAVEVARSAVDAARPERYLGAEEAIRTPQFRMAWSFTSAAHGPGTVGPATLGKAFRAERHLRLWKLSGARRRSGPFHLIAEP